MVNSPPQSYEEEPVPLATIFHTTHMLMITEGGDIVEESEPTAAQTEPESSVRPTDNAGKSTNQSVDSQNFSSNAAVENKEAESVDVNEIIGGVVSDLRGDTDLGGETGQQKVTENPRSENVCEENPNSDDCDDNTVIAQHLLNLQASGAISGKRKKSVVTKQKKMQGKLSVEKSGDVSEAVSPSVRTVKQKKGLRKQGKPVRHVVTVKPTAETVEEKDNDNEDDDVVIVSTTVGKRHTRSSAKALKKKKAELGIGEPSGVDTSTDVEVNVEKVETDKEERLRNLKKGKRVAESSSKGATASKKKRSLVDSDKESEEYLAADTADSDSESDSDEKKKGKGHLKKNDSRRRIKNRRITQDVEEVSTDGIWFCSIEKKAMFRYVYGRNIIAEKKLAEQTMSNSAYMDIIEEAGMLCLCGNNDLYWASIVREFICNMGADICDPNSANYYRVQIRKKAVKFSPEVINKQLGWNADDAVTGSNLQLQEIISTLTGGVLEKWPTKGQLAASVLTCKYAVMHKVSLVNLMPTSNSTNVSEAVGKLLYVLGTGQKLDFGQVIFDQIVDHAKTHVTLKPIGFPRLICSIILSQHPDLLKPEDGHGEEIKELLITGKLMTGKRVVDIDVPPSVKTAGLPKREVAAELIEAYRDELQMLEADNLIKQKRMSELRKKIVDLESAVPPTVSDAEIQQSDARKERSNAGGATDIAGGSSAVHEAEGTAAEQGEPTGVAGHVTEPNLAQE